MYGNLTVLYCTEDISEFFHRGEGPYIAAKKNEPRVRKNVTEAEKLEK